MFIKKFQLLAGVASLFVTSFINSSVCQAADLTIGSNAPKLDIEHWIHDGNGAFKPVSEFESGKVYVVEFWATWCGPCIASMPHLVELQNQFKDKGVQIISISDEDLETIAKFLDGNVLGAKPDADGNIPTYAELTSAYCLTADPDESVQDDYLRAAAQNGIPTAFIVGKDSKIEWIGHPMSMDEVLEAVVSDSWDREKFGEEFRAQQELEEKLNKVYALFQSGKADEAIEVLDSLPAKAINPQVMVLKLQILLSSEKMEAAREHLSTLYGKIEDNPVMTNMVAWNLYEMAQQGGFEDDSIVQASIAAMETAVKKAGEDDQKGSILDTLAHLYHLDGKLDKAIETETQALEASGEADREFIENYLAELKVEKEGQETPAVSK